MHVHTINEQYQYGLQHRKLGRQVDGEKRRRGLGRGNGGGPSRYRTVRRGLL
jgi:hypothetical protein